MKAKLQAFRNLMVFAAADGKLSEEEIAFLSLRSAKWGVTDAEFQASLDYAKRRDAEVVIPPNQKDRRELLADMLRTMALDGKLVDIERKLFATVAAAMGFEHDELNRIIDSVVKDT